MASNATAAAPAAAGKAQGKAAEAPAAAPAKPGKKKLLLIIGAAVVVLGGGAGAWFMMGSKAKPAAAEAAKPAKEAAAAKTPALYYKFDPAFVVNFGSEGNARYLQITLEAMSRDQLVVDAIKNNEPAIRNDLVLLYSAQQYETLTSAQGKEALRQQTLEAVRKVVAAEGGKPESVEAVYFTSFVIQ